MKTKTMSDLSWNQKLRIEHRAALTSIAEMLEAMDVSDWTKAEHNIYDIVSKELEK